MTNRKAIPKAQSKDRSLNQALVAMKEELDVGNGLGDPLDRKLTLRELVSLGALKVTRTLRNGGELTSGNIEVPNGANLTTPERAESFTAVATYLGVTLTWDSVRDHTSIYAELYRSETDLFSTATLVGRDQGTQFGDRSVQQGVTYFYWIRFVTNGGIEGPLHSTSGFSVTVPQSSEALLEDLSGQIAQSHLAESLSNDINTLQTEGAQRTADIQIILGEELDGALALAKVSEVERDLLRVVVGGEDNLALLEGVVSEEATARSNADTLLLQQVNTVASQSDENEASIQDTNVALASADAAMGQRVDTVQASIHEQDAKIENIETAYSGGEGSLTEKVLTLEATAIAQELTNQGDALDQAIAIAQSGETTRNIAKLKQTQTAFSDANEALSELITALRASVGNNSSELVALQSTFTDATTALSEQVNTLVAQVDEDVAAIQETLTAKADKTAEPYAMWEIKTTVNNITGSIGLFNNGSKTAVGINANQFYVFDGVDGDAVLPFVIDGDSTYINNAFIKDASIDKAKIGSVYFSGLTDAEGISILVDGKLKADFVDAENLAVSSAATFSGDVASGTFNSGTAGWALFQNGNAIFENVVINDGVFNGALSTAGGKITTSSSGPINDGTASQLIKIDARDQEVIAMTLLGGVSEYGLKIINVNDSGHGEYIYTGGVGLSVTSENSDALRASALATNQVGGTFSSSKGAAIELTTFYQPTFPSVKIGGFLNSGEDIYVGLSCDAGNRWVSMLFHQKTTADIDDEIKTVFRRAQFSAGETIPTSKKLHSDYVIGGYVDAY